MPRKGRTSINWTVVLTTLITVTGTVAVALINTRQTRAQESSALKSYNSAASANPGQPPDSALDTTTVAVQPSPIGRVFGGKVRLIKVADLRSRLGVVKTP
ncbi:MAG TPA: hypothetical protein VMH22_02465 [bacterium]|nr:hypothetical protein [bacterium]